MKPSRQNFCLFLEKNDLEFVIDSKPVHLFMNRSVVNEEDQFEIIGVYYLQKVEKLMYDHQDPDYKYHAIKRTEKEANDRNVFSEALEDASQFASNDVDTHFLIGSCFHNINDTSTSNTEKLCEYLLDEIEEIELKSVFVTFYSGFRKQLVSKETCKDMYEGKAKFDSQNSDVGSIPIPYKYKCSVNDDIEMSIRNILDGKRLQEDFNVFLNIMLTALELKQVEENDENFWMSLDNYQAKITKDIRWWAEMTNARIDKDQTNRQSTSDPNIKFVRCRIYRRSFHLKYKKPLIRAPYLDLSSGCPRTPYP